MQRMGRHRLSANEVFEFWPGLDGGILRLARRVQLEKGQRTQSLGPGDSKGVEQRAELPAVSSLFPCLLCTISLPAKGQQPAGADRATPGTRALLPGR